MSTFTSESDKTLLALLTSSQDESIVVAAAEELKRRRLNTIHHAAVQRVEERIANWLHDIEASDLFRQPDGAKFDGEVTGQCLIMPAPQVVPEREVVVDDIETGYTDGSIVFHFRLGNQWYELSVAAVQCENPRGSK